MAKKSNIPQRPQTPSGTPTNIPGGQKEIVRGQMPTMATPPPPPPKISKIK